jgi:hypothetical protein
MTVWRSIVAIVAPAVAVLILTAATLRGLADLPVERISR